MTRINLVPPSELHPKHLLAEYRELPRIFGAARKWHNRGGDPDKLPPTYRMGTGHMMFFYDKLLFCYERQKELYNTCLLCGFNVTFKPNPQMMEWAPLRLRGNYSPTQAALNINRQRIADRLAEMKQ